MEKLRSDLNELLESNSIIAAIKPYGFIFALLLPLFNVIYACCFVGFFSVFSSVLYVLYLIGLVLCFAGSMDWAVGAAFALRCLYHLILLIRIPSFNQVIYLLLYGALAFGFLWIFFTQSDLFHTAAGGGGNAWNQAAPMGGGQAPSGNTFCPHCGHPVSQGVAFCPHCGNPVRQTNAGGQAASFGGYRQPAPAPVGGVGRVVSQCGGALALVFCILLTLRVLLDIFGSFSLLGLLLAVPIIIVVIGCWMAFVSCLQNAPKPTGFTLISGGLLATQIIYIIACAAGIVAGIIVMVTGIGLEAGLFIGAGLGIVAVCIVLLVLIVFFYKSLRRSVLSARSIISGTGTVWETSLFSIVILCAAGVCSLISLGVSAIVRRMLYSVMDFMSMGGMFNGFVSSLLGVGWVNILDTIVSLAVIALAVFMLFQIRSSEPKQQPASPYVS